MQIGVRWQAGAVPHMTVPETMFYEIGNAEKLFPAATSWTLTWLENLPICTLDNVCVVKLDHSGTVHLKELNEDEDRYVEEEEDDSWLS